VDISSDAPVPAAGPGTWNPRLAAALHTSGRVVVALLFGGDVTRVALTDADEVEMDWQPPAALEYQLAVCFAGSMVELAYLEASAGLSMDAANHLRRSTIADEREALDLLATAQHFEATDTESFMGSAIDKCRVAVERATFWDLVEPIALQLFGSGAVSEALLESARAGRSELA
jgi:hypothetical protein